MGQIAATTHYLSSLYPRGFLRVAGGREIHVKKFCKLVKIIIIWVLLMTKFYFDD